MELGGDAVLVNSAVAVADNPELMAEAFGAAVRAGRQALQAGLMPKSELAVATSPLTAFLEEPVS
jgi:thiazole synthase